MPFEYFGEVDYSQSQPLLKLSAIAKHNRVTASADSFLRDPDRTLASSAEPFDHLAHTFVRRRSFWQHVARANGVDATDGFRIIPVPALIQSASRGVPKHSIVDLDRK